MKSKTLQLLLLAFSMLLGKYIWGCTSSAQVTATKPVQASVARPVSATKLSITTPSEIRRTAVILHRAMQELGEGDDKLANEEKRTAYVARTAAVLALGLFLLQEGEPSIAVEIQEQTRNILRWMGSQDPAAKPPSSESDQTLEPSQKAFESGGGL